MAGSHAMSPDEKTVLRRNQVFLVQNVELDILDHLHASGVFTKSTMEEIEAGKTRSNSIRILLNHLPTRGPTAFEVFLTCLKESGQKHIADKLNEDFRKLSGGSASKPVAEVGEAAKSLDPQEGVDGKASKPVAEVGEAAKSLDPQEGADGKAKASKPVAEVGKAAKSLDPQEGVDGKDPLSKVTHVERQLAEKLMSDKENPVYPMRSNPRGRAIIINNQYFTESLKTRQGAMKDLDNLCRLFEQLGFVVITHTDKTDQDIEKIMEEESQHKDHANADCFICFVLSHGTKDFVYGMNAKKVSIDKQIVAPFHSDRCTSLQRKPKIFFFQACQDTPAANSSEKSQDQTDAKPAADGITKGLEGLQFGDKDEDAPIIPAHKMSDLVLAYATVPGYKSWRSPDDGSLFVLAIVEIFTEYAHHDDLHSMLLKVRSRVEKTHAIYHKDPGFKQRTEFPQLPLTKETAYKKIYFFPGYYAS